MIFWHLYFIDQSTFVIQKFESRNFSLCILWLSSEFIWNYKLLYLLTSDVDIYSCLRMANHLIAQFIEVILEFESHLVNLYLWH